MLGASMGDVPKSEPAAEPPPAAGAAPTSPKARPRWRLGERASLILLLVLLALDLWARSSTDPDYYLPDLFRPLSIGLIVLFLATGFLAHRTIRRALRTLGFVTVLAVLVMEVNIFLREGGVGRIEKTDDVLLRYRYKPGHEERNPGGGPPIVVNHLGLMDLEHAIPKPANVLRVAVLTGSIANDGSIPFDDRFFRRIEAELAGAVPGKTIETINVSCEGYSTLQQVRLLEKVGLRYQPDLVVVAYMLSAASLQNGGYRRFGNSFFSFRFLPAIKRLETGSRCGIFAPFHESYSFDLVVRSSFERLDLLRRRHGFQVIVAVLPVVERFDDPVCARIYDQVVRVAGETGFPALRVPDAFIGEPVARFTKPGQADDVCHPNSEGHRRIGAAIAGGVRTLLARPIEAPAAPAGSGREAPPE
jgi:hypothetical protein